jgi:GGDEF domain-containing protein
MELGSLEIQIFVSLIVVLGTAFVALVCDFLKGNNEQLRERNIELRVRQDERERLGLHQPLSWLQNLAAFARNPQFADAVAGATSPMPQAAEPVQRVEVAEPPSRPQFSGSRRRKVEDPEARLNQWANKEELEQLAERAARLRARHEESREEMETPAAPPQPQPEATPEPVVLPVVLLEESIPAVEAPAETVSEIISEPAPEPAAVASQPERAAEAAVEPVSEPVQGPVPEVAPEPVAEVIPVADAVKVLPIDMATAEGFEPRQELDLQQELNRITAAEAPAVIAEPLPVAEPVRPEPVADFSPAPAETTLRPPVSLPAGLQGPAVLSSMMESTAPFDGVAVAIGINDYESLKDKFATANEAAFQESLERMIQSLLRTPDFATRMQEDEFILLFPGESGASAQRRLFQVSEKLWDFQLRSLGNLSVIFSWGGLEVHGETLAEAVASSRERMYQTKRNRKSPVSISSRRVVNG